MRAEIIDTLFTSSSSSILLARHFHNERKTYKTEHFSRFQSLAAIAENPSDYHRHLHAASNVLRHSDVAVNSVWKLFTRVSFARSKTHSRRHGKKQKQKSDISPIVHATTAARFDCFCRTINKKKKKTTTTTRASAIRGYVWCCSRCAARTMVVK